MLTERKGFLHGEKKPKPRHKDRAPVCAARAYAAASRLPGPFARQSVPLLADGLRIPDQCGQSEKTVDHFRIRDQHEESEDGAEVQGKQCRNQG